MTTRVPLVATQVPRDRPALRTVPSPRVAAGADLAAWRSPYARMRVVQAAVAAVVVASAVAFVTGAATCATAFAAEGADPRGPGAPLGTLRISTSAAARLDDVSSLSSTATTVSVSLLCLAFLALLPWQSVVVANQRALGVPRPRYGPWRAGLAWIVPVWSFVGPKRAYDDAWRAAAPLDVPVEPERGTDREKVPLVFTVWWSAWVVGGVFRVFAARTPLGTIGDRLTLEALSTVAAAALAVSGLGLIGVVRRITRRQLAAREA